LDKHLDLPGSLTVTSGTILFVYALTNAGNEGFALFGTLLPLSISILILAGFVVIESRSKALGIIVLSISAEKAQKILTPVSYE
jgi:hypothetical protein